MRDNIEGYQNIWRCARLTGIEKKWDTVKIPNLIQRYKIQIQKKIQIQNKNTNSKYLEVRPVDRN